jgi:hypothetical protein
LWCDREMKLQRELIHGTDWRTLIIFDACRYDYFKEAYDKLGLNQPLKPVWSAGWDTLNWYINTWTDRYLRTIIASDNPVPWSVNQGVHYKKFYKGYPLWRERGNILNDSVSLDEVVNKAVEIRNEHQDKRALLHLLPPHLPYYYEEGQRFLLKTFNKQSLEDGRIYTVIQNYGRTHGWVDLIKNYIKSISTTLKIVLEKDWGTNTIISSDHGELIGEGGYYIHSLPSHGEEPKLRVVPWVTLT